MPLPMQVAKKKMQKMASENKQNNCIIIESDCYIQTWVFPGIFVPNSRAS